MSNKNLYCEYSTCLPVYELFYVRWEDKKELMVKDDRLFKIGRILNVDISQEIIEQHHSGKIKMIDVFHSKDDEVFIYIDHFKEETDQNDMVYLAVRVLREDEEKVYPIFKDIYMKNNPRCNMQIDYWNQSNYSRVFKSDFYLKKQPEYSDRILNRYNCL
ncbi:MAG: hypothetical protein AAFY76_02980 [Cyanobacteria bacterium J06649_11]